MLLDKVLTVTISANIEQGISLAPFSTQLEVSYVTDGPKFEDLFKDPVITCSQKDKGFTFKLPNLTMGS